MQIRAQFALIVLSAFLGDQSLASVVGKSAFSPSATVEGFEGIADHTNVSIAAPYTFASGVTLTEPGPGGYGSFGPYIVEGGFFGLSSQRDIPDGQAYFGQANPHLYTGPIEFTFAQPVLRVGAYICTDDPADGSDNTPVDFEAYDASGNLLESYQVDNVEESQWANNFVGLQETTPIAKVRFDGFGGGVLRIDDLTWDAVPEPSMLFLVGLGLIATRRSRGTLN